MRPRSISAPSVVRPRQARDAAAIRGVGRRAHGSSHCASMTDCRCAASTRATPARLERQASQVRASNARPLAKGLPIYSRSAGDKRRCASRARASAAEARSAGASDGTSSPRSASGRSLYRPGRTTGRQGVPELVRVRSRQARLGATAAQHHHQPHSVSRPLLPNHHHASPASLWQARTRRERPAPPRSCD